MTKTQMPALARATRTECTLIFDSATAPLLGSGPGPPPREPADTRADKLLH
ncbi:hypothetical protein AB0M95_13050 [Sphaerisporangium sp. NPDC051017]|uniref:hypothetical protein n=1 Tax=unclassified Sphaerisporangium TaxID=2630420 RepID=UPI0033CFBFFB